MANNIKPDHIEQISADSLIISWSDGRKCIYNTKMLRRNCPCAVCREEREDDNPLKVLKTDLSNLELVKWKWIGNYAISLEWNDQHDTGIYTYDFLLELCENNS
jgi:DUF971 family protein